MHAAENKLNGGKKILSGNGHRPDTAHSAMEWIFEVVLRLGRVALSSVLVLLFNPDDYSAHALPNCEVRRLLSTSERGSNSAHNLIVSVIC